MSKPSDFSVLEVFNPLVDSAQRCSVPLYAEHIEAGFPSPAQDYVDQCMDLNELCIRHPATAFFVRVKGESMVEGGIGDGDILIVEGSFNPRHGDIVVACVDDALTVKRLELHPEPKLVPMNRDYKAIAINPDNETSIVGVVTNVIHPLR